MKALYLDLETLNRVNLTGGKLQRQKVVLPL